jgi:hypothetical protein
LLHSFTIGIFLTLMKSINTLYTIFDCNKKRPNSYYSFLLFTTSSWYESNWQTPLHDSVFLISKEIFKNQQLLAINSKNRKKNQWLLAKTKTLFTSDCISILQSYQHTAMNTPLISDTSIPSSSPHIINPTLFNYYINRKLDETNFLLWKSQMLPVIRGHWPSSLAWWHLLSSAACHYSFWTTWSSSAACHYSFWTTWRYCLLEFLYDCNPLVNI